MLIAKFSQVVELFVFRLMQAEFTFPFRFEIRLSATSRMWEAYCTPLA